MEYKELVSLIKKLYAHTEHWKNFVKFYPKGKIAIWDSGVKWKPYITILFVGEAPGPQETLKGIPFVGRSGQLLRKFLKWLNEHNVSWYLTNAVPFMPTTQTGRFEAPTKEEIEIWKPYLMQIIKGLQANVIIALGAVPIEALLGRRYSPIKDSGLVLGEVEGKKVSLFPHPSYLLRRGQTWEEYLTLFDKLIRYLKEDRKNVRGT